MRGILSRTMRLLSVTPTPFLDTISPNRLATLATDAIASAPPNVRLLKRIIAHPTAASKLSPTMKVQVFKALIECREFLMRQAIKNPSHLLLAMSIQKRIIYNKEISENLKRRNLVILLQVLPNIIPKFDSPQDILRLLNSIHRLDLINPKIRDQCEKLALRNISKFSIDDIPALLQAIVNLSLYQENLLDRISCVLFPRIKTLPVDNLASLIELFAHISTHTTWTDHSLFDKLVHTFESHLNKDNISQQKIKTCIVNALKLQSCAITSPVFEFIENLEKYSLLDLEMLTTILEAADLDNVNSTKVKLLFEKTQTLLDSEQRPHESQLIRLACILSELKLSKNQKFFCKDLIDRTWLHRSEDLTADDIILLSYAKASLKYFDYFGQLTDLFCSQNNKDLNHMSVETGMKGLWAQEQFKIFQDKSSRSPETKSVVAVQACGDRDMLERLCGALTRSEQQPKLQL